MNAYKCVEMFAKSTSLTPWQQQIFKCLKENLTDIVLATCVTIPYFVMLLCPSTVVSRILGKN